LVGGLAGGTVRARRRHLERVLAPVTVGAGEGAGGGRVLAGVAALTVRPEGGARVGSVLSNIA